MKRAPLPIFVGERQAAQLFDLKPVQFRALVEGGQLPKPKTIGEFERWDRATDAGGHLRRDGCEQTPGLLRELPARGNIHDLQSRRS